MDAAGNACKGKIIRDVRLNDSKLHIQFDDRTLILEDTGQNCCEHRYMTCDDNLHYLEGQAFAGYHIADGPDIKDEHSEVHNVQFLIVEAALISITVANHNEHNGYYGGFNVSAYFEGER